MTDDQRRAHQRKEWPKCDKIEPRWPRRYMLGLANDGKIHPRKF
jgi:hypothetical protein